MSTDTVGNNGAFDRGTWGRLHLITRPKGLHSFIIQHTDGAEVVINKHRIELVK